MQLHPASLIFLWLALLLFASTFTGAGLALVSVLLLLGALFVAASHLLQLLRRSRWLLLMLVILFGWMTPGTPIIYLPGASIEGLQLGAEQLGRLVLALAALAIVLRVLSPVELVAGMRTLLRPLEFVGLPRDRIAVRVALTLEAVENAGTGMDSATVLQLPRHAFGFADGAVAILSFILLAIMVWR